MRYAIRHPLLPALVAGLTLSCADSPAKNTIPDVVNVYPDVLVLQIGEGANFLAHRIVEGDLVTHTGLEVLVRDTTVARIEPGDRIVALAPGETRIVAIGATARDSAVVQVVAGGR